MLIPEEHSTDMMTPLKVDDVHVDLYVYDLQHLMVQYYRANVMVNESKATSIQLTTIKHSIDSKSSAL